jgi:poly(hydroxyalkanoate) depolymerase family esterase
MLPILAALVQVTSFGSNPGSLDMYEYVPASLAAGAPLVVVMHGCTQNASAIEVAGWNALADEYGFAVLYPQQRTGNQPLDCFLWYSPSDTARAKGEAESIVQMVDTEVSTHAIDPTHVYATGVSAGGAFTAVMLATYPDRFAAGSVMSGIVYGCATDLTSASACTAMQSSAQKPAAAWGDLVRAADPGYSGSPPRVQIWQGTADTTVDPANATELVKQWTNVAGIDQTPTATDTIGAATRTRYGSAVELYMVTGMGHAIATGDDPLGPCPAGSGAYFSDVHLCSTLRAADFFGLTANAPVGSGSDSGASHSDGGGCSTGGGASPLVMLLALLGRYRTRHTKLIAKR